jgi:hypothetical protein
VIDLGQRLSIKEVKIGENEPKEVSFMIIDPMSTFMTKTASELAAFGTLVKGP